MVDISKVRAIDFHTHAEEPCGNHIDDGYDEIQATMANHFGAPRSHPPTMQQTAQHNRLQNIAAVIFPVDAERETGYCRYRFEKKAIKDEVRPAILKSNVVKLLGLQP